MNREEDKTLSKWQRKLKDYFESKGFSLYKIEQKHIWKYKLKTEKYKSSYLYEKQKHPGTIKNIKSIADRRNRILTEK